MNKIMIVVAAALVAAAVLGVLVMNGTLKLGPAGPRTPAEPIEFQKGIGFCSWSNSGYSTFGADESMDEMNKLGNNWVSILVTWYQTNTWSGDIHRTDLTPTDEAVLHAAKRAHEAGKKVMLKLHLDLASQEEGSWRGEICSRTEGDWKLWSKAYADFVMHYVDLANGEKIEMICVGTELNALDTAKGFYWSELARKVRRRYAGKITYAAHWDNYYNIRFWKDMDYIGINAYFPLSEKINPSLEELREAWKKWLAEIEEFQAKEAKPIIFPEAGCNSADDGAIRPWEHRPSGAVNLRLQKDFYTALLETFYDKGWFYGLYWWFWGTSKHMGGPNNRDFTPQNKPARDVIKEWYARPR